MSVAPLAARLALIATPTYSQLTTEITAGALVELVKGRIRRATWRFELTACSASSVAHLLHSASTSNRLTRDENGEAIVIQKRLSTCAARAACQTV